MTYLENVKTWWIDSTTKDSSATTVASQPQTVTVPLGTTAPKTVAKLDEAGNVPLVKTAQTSQSTGLGVEKAQTSQTKGTETIKATKKGTTLDQALTKFYGKNYTSASEEDKEKLIVKYFDWLSADKKDVISQLDQFKLYRDRCSDEDEYKRLSSVIDKMEAKYQLNAAKTVITEGTDRQKDIGQKAVADDYQHYDSSVQIGVAGLIVDSKNKEAIKIGASHLSELDSTRRNNTSNQVEAVKIFEKTEVSDNAKVNDEFQKQIDKVIVNQYNDFAVDSQLDIHQIMSTSRFSETIEYAASNIGQLNKINQEQAFKITYATGNEKAIKKAEQSLADAKAKSEKEDKIKEEKKSEAEKEEKSAEIKDEKETSKASVAEKVSKIINSKENNRLALLKDTIGKASEVEKLALISSLSPTELGDVLGIILSSNPSSEVRIKAMSALDQLDERTRRGIVQDLNKICSSDTTYSQIGLYGTGLQKVFVEQSAKEGKLNYIDRNMLFSSAKMRYDELLKEGGKRYDIG